MDAVDSVDSCPSHGSVSGNVLRGQHTEQFRAILPRPRTQHTLHSPIEGIVNQERAPGQKIMPRYHCSHPGCESSFTRASDLKRHARNHVPSDQHPFACGCCLNAPGAGQGYSSERKDHVEQHLRKSHGIKESSAQLYLCRGCPAGQYTTFILGLESCVCKHGVPNHTTLIKTVLAGGASSKNPYDDRMPIHNCNPRSRSARRPRGPPLTSKLHSESASPNRPFDLGTCSLGRVMLDDHYDDISEMFYDQLEFSMQWYPFTSNSNSLQLQSLDSQRCSVPESQPTSRRSSERSSGSDGTELVEQDTNALFDFNIPLNFLDVGFKASGLLIETIQDFPPEYFLLRLKGEIVLGALHWTQTNVLRPDQP